MTTERLEPIDGANWEVFLKAPWAVLMLGKSDCDHCNEFTEELNTFLTADTTYTDVRFGKILLHAERFLISAGKSPACGPSTRAISL